METSAGRAAAWLPIVEDGEPLVVYAADGHFAAEAVTMAAVDEHSCTVLVDGRVYILSRAAVVTRRDHDNGWFVYDRHSGELVSGGPTVTEERARELVHQVASRVERPGSLGVAPGRQLAPRNAA